MYKRIDLDNLKEIQEELIQYDFFNRFTSSGKWKTNESEVEGGHVDFNPLNTSAAYFEKIPDLKKLKLFLDKVINVDLVSHFYIMNFEKKFHSDIHRDVDCMWAFNIPILNCEKSVTVFYNDSRSELDRITLDVPHFLNVGRHYHQIINHSDQNRLSMSIRFISDDLEKIVK
jgi:hypothetical protein